MIRSFRHPGHSIKDACLDPLDLSITEGAKVLGVTRHTLSRVINGRSGISPDMAIRLEKAGWSNADHWLRLQTAFALAEARARADEIHVVRYEPATVARTAASTAFLGEPVRENRESDPRAPGSFAQRYRSRLWDNPIMRPPADAEKIRRLLEELGRRARGPGRVYLAGGATALLIGWRANTVDVDLKLDPEPDGIFEAIAALKDDLDVNIELASPEQFLPALPDWRRRSVFIGRHERRRVLPLRPARPGTGQAGPRLRPRPPRRRGHARARPRLDRRAAVGPGGGQAGPAPVPGARCGGVRAPGAAVPRGARMIDLDGLPGAPRVERGRRDLARGRWTVDAWWLAAARTRLRALGVDLPLEIEPPRPPELALYEALAAEGEDPYFRYNALRAELASFLSALEARVERENRKRESSPSRRTSSTCGLDR
jgi:addiction module HigA family antidote